MVRRLAFTVTDEDMEDVLDTLLPLVPQGVYQLPAEGGTVELAAFDTAGDLPPLAELEAAIGPQLLGAGEEDAPDDAGERRVQYSRRAPVAGRVAIRASDAPRLEGDGLLDLIIDSPGGAFGSGNHPTTRMCLELLLGIEPGGSLADLGCGAGVLAIAAAMLGWAPVFAIDHELSAVDAVVANARRNGVELEAAQGDLLVVPPPRASLLAANVPIAVHLHLADVLPDEVEHVIVSGIVAHHAPEVVAAYARRGLDIADKRDGPGWIAILLER
ncbi:MAG: ribosomal protein methyltransferase [Solirubrobacteraceae bacterium]|nr:ribosomal protein methyltransferase [Solirubrobacteraceae bacterium]